MFGIRHMMSKIDIADEPMRQLSLKARSANQVAALPASGAANEAIRQHGAAGETTARCSRKVELKGTPGAFTSGSIGAQKSGSGVRSGGTRRTSAAQSSLFSGEIRIF